MLRKPKLWLAGVIAGFLFWLVYVGVGWLPHRLRYWALLPIAKVIFRLWKSRRELIIRNIFLIRRDLVNDEEDAAWINVKTLVYSWSSLLGTERVNLSKMRKRINGGEAVRDAVRAGKKVVVVFPHVGDINSFTAALKALELEAFIPAENLPPVIFKLMSGLRSRHGNIEFAPVQKGQMKQICQQKLSEGKIVGLAMDITTKKGKGVDFVIGNGEATFRVGAVEIAQQAGAELFLAFPKWDGKQTYLTLEPFVLARGRSVETNTLSLLCEYRDYLQANVLQWWRVGFMDMREV